MSTSIKTKIGQIYRQENVPPLFGFLEKLTSIYTYEIVSLQ
jgi:hypothetical protein